MKKWYCIVLSLMMRILVAQTWITNPISNSPNGVFVDVSLTFDSSTNQVFAAWADGDSSGGGAPYYSIYDPLSMIWTTNQIPSSPFGVFNDVSLTFDSSTNQVFAAWVDSNSPPYYSIYDPLSMTWTTNPISNSPNGAFIDVSLTFDSSTNQVFAAWTDGGNRGGVPYYSIYDPLSMIWTTNPIPNSPNGVLFDVSLTFDSSTNQVFAAWTDGDNSGGAPYYSIYDPLSMTWTTNPISNSPNGVIANVSLTFDSSTNQVFAAWVDSNSPPYYSIYDPLSMTWTTNPIPNSPNGVLYDVSLTFDSSTNQVFAAWTDGDSSGGAPYYSIYDPLSMTWTTNPISNSPNGVISNVSLTFDSSTSQVFAAWGDNGAAKAPYYSTFSTSTLPLPPSSGNGKKITNRFPYEKEWFNSLNWTASPSANVIRYNVKRNGKLIAKDLMQLNFNDFNRPENGIDIYAITSIDTDGNESSPLIITVR